MPKSNEEIFNEVQAQIAENARKNEAYFKKMEKTLQKSNSTLRDIKILMRRDEENWMRCGIDINNLHGENPFLLLEKIAPEAFRGLSEWAARARSDAEKKFGVTSDGINDIGNMNLEPFKSIPQSTKTRITSDSSSEKPKARKSVRRVRI